MKLPNPEDDSDRRLLADVKEYGWHLISIPEDDEGPSFTFSVGLYHSFKQPELILFGIGAQTAQIFVNEIALRVKKGECCEVGVPDNSLSDSCAFAFTPFGKSYYKTFLGYALWFYDRVDFPVLQMVWSDRALKLPWDEGFDQAEFSTQPVYSQNETHCWPFTSPKNTATYTHASIVNRTSPILRVVHDAAGEWQFLDGYSPADAQHACVVSLRSIVEIDKTILALGHLPRGGCATRESVGAKWKREQST